jgi:putative addiction module CopG family antidote
MLEIKGGGRMTTQLPADLEQFIQAKVLSGRFASHDEVIAAGVRLLRQQEEAEEACVVEGIRQGLEDMHGGRGRPAEEVLASIRREFNLPTEA